MKKYFLFLFVVLNYFASAQIHTAVEPFTQKIGFIDKNDSAVIDYIYDYAYEFNGNTTLARIDTNYYVINKKGKKILKFSDKVIHISKTKDRYCYFEKGAMVVIDTLGKEVSRLLADRFDRWGESDTTGIWVATKDGKSGFVNTSGKILIPMEYEPDNYQETFSWDGNLYFQDGAIFKLKHNGKWGIMSMYGKVILPFEYESLETVQYNSNETGFLFGAGTKDGKHVFINSQYKNIAFDFDTCPGFFNIMTQAVLLKDNKVLFYDTYKAALVDSFTFVGGRSNDHGRGSTWEESRALKIDYKGKHMIVNNKGKVIYPFSADRAEAFYVKGKLYFAINRSNLFALFDAKLKQLTEFNFISMSVYKDEIFATDMDAGNFKISETGEAKHTVN